MALTSQKENISCDAVQNELCAAVEGCAARCGGACADPIEKWLDCVVDYTPGFPEGGCPIDCLNTFDDGGVAETDGGGADASTDSGSVVTAIRRYYSSVASMLLIPLTVAFWL